MEINKETAESIYQNLSNNIDNLETKALELAIAKHELSEAKEKILLEYSEKMKDLGTNEAARTAKINSLLETETENVKKLETELQKLNTKVKLSQLEIEKFKIILRTMEIKNENKCSCNCG